MRLGSGSLATAMILLLMFPIVALALSVTPANLREAVADPQFGPALWLSLRTTAISQLIAVAAGTALAWRALALPHSPQGQGGPEPPAFFALPAQLPHQALHHLLQPHEPFLRILQTHPDDPRPAGIGETPHAV